MKRLPVLVVSLVVVVVVAAATAVGVVMADRDDHPRSRMGSGMMSAGSSSTPGWWDDESWDSMMAGQMMMGPMLMGPMMMGSSAVASESEYLAAMVAHHEEAVAAAGELARSDRPQMRDFGQAIVRVQTLQIEQMTAWLAEWYPEQAPMADYEPMMRDLTSLSGDRLDLAFLQDMIGHHMAAVMMSQHLLWSGPDHDEVAQLARSIRDDQHAEILQMQRWLAQWFNASWRGMGMGMGMGRHMMSGLTR